jgi:hypothetical protein
MFAISVFGTNRRMERHIQAISAFLFWRNRSKKAVFAPPRANSTLRNSSECMARFVETPEISRFESARSAF